MYEILIAAGPQTQLAQDHREDAMVILLKKVIMTKYSSFNPFIIGISSAITGAVLGSLPGMAIGGITGYLKRKTLPKATDAGSEPKDTVPKAVLLPLIAAITVILFYIYEFMAWLEKVLLKN